MSNPATNQEDIYIAPCIVAFERGSISNEVARDRLVEWMDQHLFWNIYCRGSNSSVGTLRRQRES